MHRPSDPVVAALDRRIDDLELALVRVVGVVTIALLVIGGFKPWITESVDGEEHTYGLFAAPFAWFSVLDVDDSEGILFGIAVLVLGATTVAALLCLWAAMAGEWSRSWIGTTVIALLVCCIAGAGLTSLMFTFSENGGADDVRWSGYLMWSAGALVTMWVLTTRLGRRLKY